MTHNYNLTGMTCGNCKAAVEKALGAISGISSVNVDLAKSEAEIKMSKHISVMELQSALPDKYIISEKKKEQSDSENTFYQEEEKSKFEQLKPLFLILLYISVASILMHSGNWDINAMMLDFMGLFFIVFSFFKMLDLKGFPDSFRMYDPLAKRLPFYAKVYPFIETALGLMFLMRFQIPTAIIVTIVLLSITTIGVTKTLLDKKSIRCACLGTALKLPMTEATFVENAIMLVMAVGLLFSQIN